MSPLLPAWPAVAPGTGITVEDHLAVLGLSRTKLNVDSAAGLAVADDPANGRVTISAPQIAAHATRLAAVEADTSAALIQPVAQEALGRLDAQLSDVRILVIGDSTGNAADEWVFRVAQLLGARYPKFTVEHRAWNDVADAYDAPTTIQTGTGVANAGGPFKLQMFNCSVAGWNTFHAQGAGTWNTKVTAVAPHLAFVSLGHNDGAAVAANAWYDNLAVFTEAVTRAAPQAGLILIAQNPRSADSSMDLRRYETQRWARTKGYGFIDVWGAFVAAAGGLGNVATLLQGDGVHPTNPAATAGTGSNVWATEVMRHMGYDRRALISSLQRPSSYDDRVTNLLVNGDFSIPHGRIVLGAAVHTNASPVVGVTSTVGLVVGAYVTSGLLPANTQILSVDSATQITCNRNATGTGNVTLTQPQGFAYWNPTNVSADAVNLGVQKDTVNFESLPPNSGGMSPATGWSARLQSLAAGQAFIKQTVPAKLCAGQWVFLAARVRRSADVQSLGRCTITQFLGTAEEAGTGPGSTNNNSLLGFSTNFVWIGCKRRITADVSSMEVVLWADTGATGTADVSFDRAILRLGAQPGDVKRALAA